MNFLFQVGDFSAVEKRTVQAAAMLNDYSVRVALLENLPISSHLPIFPPTFIKAGVVAVPVSTTPVGTVEFVKKFLSEYEYDIPEAINYPECLESCLCRKVRTGVVADAKDYEFVKPLHSVKKFTGGILSELGKSERLDPMEPVWISEPVKFVSEWRYYIVDHEIVGAGRYDDGLDDAPEPYVKQVMAAVWAMKAKYDLAGYSLDFGVLDDGRTALVEVNDGWALGYYKGSCKPNDYARLLHNRWQQIIRKVEVVC